MSELSVEPENLIQVMPESLANKIAAGEVVQRPASALKELVENALDAGADEISIILKSAGSELIQVVDNGCGMSRADAQACFKRHATSKISAIEDLEHIRTLGFRGEALASIASVAQVELRTKRKGDAAGFRLRINGGAIHDAEPFASHDGTSIAVRNLFYNVPARRNFLKTPATELKHLIETFQFLALSNPGTAFSFVHDEMEMFRLPAEKTTSRRNALEGRIIAVLGEEYAEHLIAVDERTSYLSVEGFTGAPKLNRRSRSEQFLFVNGRFVRNRSLDHAILSAYEDLLPENTYPFYALFLTLDPSRVDVNVHPTKAEVKFDDERGIYNFLKSIVRKALGTALLSPQFETAMHMSEGAGPAAFRIFGEGGPPPGGNASRWPEPWKRADSPGVLSERLYGAQPSPVGADEGLEDALLWQLHDKYILTQIRSGLMILDQNAAHERILYERALEHMKSGFGLSQQLLFPHTAEFSPIDFELLKELMPDLRALGFDLELFSGRSVSVRGVPAESRSGDEKSILDEILAQYKANRERLRVGSRENLAKSMARRSAIRPGSRLSPKEMRSLIDQLFACEMPYACPSGRPVIVKIPIEELDKRFSR